MTSLLDSDSDASTPSYLSPEDDDDYNMSDYDGEEEDDHLPTDAKTKAVREGFAMHDVNSPNNDSQKCLSTQPASQSVTKQRRTSPRGKQKGITSAIVDAMKGETESLVIPKKPKPQEKQHESLAQASTTITKPPTQTPTHTKQPPMKKRKVSLSPTDSLAKQQPKSQVIDLLADDDDDDSDDEILAVKRDRMNNATAPQPRLSPSMLAAANKQQKEHVTKEKQKKEAKNTKTQSRSKVSEAMHAEAIGEKPKALESAKSNTQTKAGKEVPPANASTKAKKKNPPKAKSTTSKTKDDSQVKSKPAKTTSKQTEPKVKAPAASKPPAKKKKKRITFEEELLQKMFLSCRPYAIRDLVQLMGKTTSEASVNFCLLSLIDKKWVIKKEFKSGSRTKELYWANQESKDKKLWALDCLQLPSAETVRDTRMELATLQQQQKTLIRDIEEIEKTPSNEQLAVLCQTAQTEVDALNAKLTAMKARIVSGAQLQKPKKLGLASRNHRFGSNKMVPKKAQTPLQLKKRINAMRDHWIKRRCKCMDFVEALAEGMEKKVKDVVNKVLELETDEDAKAVLPPKHAV